MAEQMVTTAFEVVGMDCAGCARKIDGALRAIDGVADVALHYPDTMLGVLHAPHVDDAALIAAVAALGFGATRDDAA